MKHTLVQVDDFHPDPYGLRAAAIKSEFKTVTGPDGAPYTGVSQFEDPLFIPLVEAALQGKVTPLLQGWRLNFEKELPHNPIHSDDLCSGWACVHYMNLPEQCQGGTAFWRHRMLNLTAMPSAAEIPSFGTDVPSFEKEMEKDCADASPWDMAGYVGMKFNRAIFYPTSQFHSRWPFEGFGTTPEDGRLIKVCFFNLTHI